MIIYFILGSLVVYFLWNYIYEKNWDKGLVLNLRFIQNTVYEGQIVQLEEKIENQKKLPIPVVEIAFKLNRELIFDNLENTSYSDKMYKRDIFSLMGWQRITRKLIVNCTKRGLYDINQIDYTSKSLFYDKDYINKKDIDTYLYVYAKRVNVSKILIACQKVIGSKQCNKRLYEDPFAFSGIREYVISDPMKRVNWKASAKTGNLMVNTFDSTETSKVMIYLDVEDGGIRKAPLLIEDEISTAATLAQKLILSGSEVGIRVNIKDGESFININPVADRNNIVTIEQILAKLNGKEKNVDFNLCIENPVEDAVAVIISKNYSRNYDVIKSFFKAGNDGIWVLPYMFGDIPKLDAIKSVNVITREVDSV